jgi:hypothetical protein
MTLNGKVGGKQKVLSVADELGLVLTAQALRDLGRRWN